MPKRASVSWPQALAWRLRRQLLDPVSRASVHDVVARLGAVAAQPALAAETAVAARRRDARRGDVAAAVAEGSIIAASAFRGAVHLMTPEDGGVYLALRAASRMWELPSWQNHYGLAPGDWPRLREAVRQTLAAGPVTLPTLGATVTRRRRFAHLREVFAGGAGTLIKPLMWQGDMSYGPPRDGKPTFQLLDVNPRWAGIPDVDQAGPRAVLAYLRVYGPAEFAHLQYWLGEGLGVGRKRIRSWIADLGDRLAEIDVDGETALVAREDVDCLAGTRATTAVRLLPGYDQWVLGPGTSDTRVVPAGRRTLVSRKASLVIAGGVVSGTWSVTRDRLAVTWFTEVAPPDRDALDEQATWLGEFLGRPLDLVIES